MGGSDQLLQDRQQREAPDRLHRPGREVTDPGHLRVRPEFLRLEPTFARDRDFVAQVLPTLDPTGSGPDEREL
ncbi:MAG TPA: hypothetical protein VE525_17655 [Rubrobacter sp.]|nr:hypothetical protein [Rubrobacter sp.]